MSYQIGVAGSTKYTAFMAEALLTDQRFEIAFTLSPTPRQIGREKTLQKNPLHVWSENNGKPAILIDKKIESTLKEQLEKYGEIDFLLVVDFGYLIPKWLLNYPKIAPLNIHPSELPKWRGSSPGQFVLLSQKLEENSRSSAITLMVMDQALDRGPVISQLPFRVDENWNQRDYYNHAFDLLKPELANLIADFAEGKIQPKTQILESPTPIARRLDKSDSFVAWEYLQKLMESSTEKVSIKNVENGLLNELLRNEKTCPNKSKQVQLVCNACKAFYPWPGLWSLVKTNRGEKRLKILSCHLNNQQLVLDEVQLEGKQSCTFRECKNAILD